MKRSLMVFALMALLIAAGCARELDYNVLVITIDTLRPDRLGCYGYERPTSPRIDEFAAGSVLFEFTRSNGQGLGVDFEPGIVDQLEGDRLAPLFNLIFVNVRFG